MSMRTIKLIVSDLHVASGDTMLDGFGERQQAALEGLLAAAGRPPIHRGAGSPLGEGDEVELILNGDCFDFLIVEPHDTGGVMHAGLAVEKLRRVIAAHGPFFETLHRFVRQPGRRMTLMAFQQQVVARSPGWKEPLGEEAALQAQAQAMMEVAMLRETLSRVGKDEGLTEAIATICTPTTAAIGDSVAAGMHHVLHSDPSLRYALAGHTHTACIDPIKGGTAEQQVYLNTGCWMTRLALPAPEEVTPELVAWLREPDRGHIPLREVPPQCVFALVNATTEEPSSASLCIWEGGSSGQYGVLAS
jgi:hypothetical protein